MFGSMKMGTKILAAFAVALALMITVGAIAYVGATGITGHLRAVAEVQLPSSNALWKANEAQTDAGRNINKLMIPRIAGPARREARGSLDDAMARIDEGVKEYEAFERSAAEELLWQGARAKLGIWQGRMAHLLPLVDERDRLVAEGRPWTDEAVRQLDERAWQSYVEMAQAFRPAGDALIATVEQSGREAAASGAEGVREASREILLIVLAILAGAALLAVIGAALSRAISRTVRDLLAEAAKLRDAVARGTLDVRGDAARIDHEFRGIVQGMNETMDAFAKPIAVTTDYVTRISNGDLPPPITDRYEGDFNQIKDALNRCTDRLSTLLRDMDAMARAQVAGDIEAFVDPTRFEGAYRRLAEGGNANVKLHVDAILEFFQVLQAYAAGDFSKTLRKFPGKQAIANEVVDGVRDNLRRVAAEVTALTRAAVEGRLSVRADASAFQGDWAALVRGVNETLDAVVGPLNVAARYVERISAGDIPPKIAEQYRGDFAAVKENLNKCVDAVNALVADANGLAEAAVAGKLSTRADGSRHAGDFRKIVDGVNRTLDAVLAPVNEATQVLERLAERDLRARVQGTYQGDHARIQQSVNATAEALHDALGQVAEAVEQVSSAASQIASSSQAVASGASEQAASLEETSASVESVASMTKQSADNAQQANQLAVSARGAATEGAASMDQMQAAMGKIKASAEGTSQIIKDINEIAFQTNLLALNAAVEAARAGEAGRGFAVVAEEVRSLALRAKEAAMKTEELIRQSVKEAGEGEVTARHVAGKLSDIVQGVSKVTAIVSEIAAAAKEQATGIDQVNKAVTEMDKVTQQNAASAEESSSAASELSAQSEELAAMVAGFQLERRGAVKPAARTKPALLPPRTPARANGHANGHANGRRNGRAADRLFPMEDDPEVREF